MKNAVSGIIAKSKAFGDVLEWIRGGQLPCSVLGVTAVARPYVAQGLQYAAKRTIIYITATEQAARDYAAASGGLLFPDNDLNLRNVEAKGREGEMERIRALKDAGKGSLVFLSARAAMTRLVPKDVFYAACFLLECGKSYDMQQLLTLLTQGGYERAGTVYSKGEFAKRGEIVDVYPSDAERPLRITFFDDEIESLRFFDAETQKSMGKPIQSYKLPPAREVVMTADAKKKMFAYLNGQSQEYEQVAGDIRYEIEEYGAFEIADTFLSVLYEKATIFDYFEDAVLLFDDFERIESEAKRIRTEFEDAHARLVRSCEAFDAQKDSLLPFREIVDGREGAMVDFAGSTSGGLKTTHSAEFGIRAATGASGRMDLLAANIKNRLEHGYRVYLFAGAKAASLSKALEDYDLLVPVAKEFGEHKVVISEGYLSNGFEVASPRMLALGTNDIFGRVKKKVGKKRKADAGEDIFSDLSPGDYVVHDIHGKGKYIGLKTMEAGGNIAEYMELEYRGGDKLYIPTAQVDRVQKYIGSEDAEVQLSKLGGREWENAKAKVRESALKLAFDLVDLYSARFEHNGYAFSPDTVWQRQFEDAFEFEETDGQVQSLVEIKKDMESPRVMDRLLLGDVGYGKTEVAMRAAMKAVLDSKQVAVLVPTTLLARQHLQTFRKRFENFPVTIEGLTRFGKSRHKQIVEDVRRGKVDIIIGTHRLLSDDVRYNDLGLLIVDEEQRFGVNHKEKIKVIKQSVDVLTLSATPIPRTLEMSLTGIRDMSTIDTPPAMRVQPYSYVMRYSDGLLRDAIMREIHRDGQAYFVCRQIREMDKLMDEVKRNVPEARVAAAHGQMPEHEIERVVSGFIEGEYDVLLCTTIIESGIDIPSVNTIVVYEADKFGLSQLYQLKGRVGRSDQSSYAYFTYLGDGVMNETAAKRLEAIREFTQLGSGFKIAMRDLQIRGAGNMLGAEQSGHMATVGYSMYVKLMREAVRIARGKRVQPEFETAVELNVPAYIPDRYIGAQTDKMDIYRLVSKIHSLGDAKAASAEIADRYGKTPKEVDNLILAAVIKSYAQRAGIASVIKKPKQIELKFSELVQPDVKKLLKLVEEYGEHVILRASTPAVIVFKQEAAMPTQAFFSFLAKLKAVNVAK
ncbi:transcription-repair coupling factor [Christensenellaceae bacterium OttesenSCG-928-K19]|nr:transcription-repair coupling factor [Christensenellaceae bacterium OttesenSCG-928-K19]